MFPVRYVSGGLLFLKPLGTFINMIPKPISVNSFSVCYESISTRKMDLIFHIFAAGLAWIRCA